MTKLQFRVLYREFLFRVVDLEVLSAHAQGDASKLLGQFASLLIFVGLGLAFPALGFGGPPPMRLFLAWSMEHFLIATTMLVVGLFAVLSWDSTFPDRRDVLVLAPLPVRARTLFLAKMASVATALGFTVACLHAAAGFLWPIALNTQTPAQAAPMLTYDPAKPPVRAADMKWMLDHDLAQALNSGVLAPGTGAGVAIGISEHGARQILTYGTAKPDSIFEIGSISKTFTGLVLAQMVAQRRVRLDEPVRELLPAGTVTKPAGNEITLLNLATHYSGLPPIPSNLNRSGTPNPGADYHAADLYEFVAKHGVAKPAESSFLYSNLGFGLLGQALANREGMTYADLVHEDVTGPLGMTDTAVLLSPEQQGRLIQAYSAEHQPIPAWDLDALAGAGAIRSTAGDMLTFLEANLHPGRLTVSNLQTLPAALQKSHELHAEIGPNMRIALAWIYNIDTGTYLHNGAISGYISYAFFNPKGDYAAIVLVNQLLGPIPFSELLGQHIRQRLAGEPAISLASVRAPPSGGLVRLVRWFAAYWITMLAAGAFIFCCVLGLQGLAAQLLPRRLFLRASSFLQLASFCVFVSGYFLQPVLATPDAILKAQGHGLLAWSPSYWFLGLFQQLSGSPALAPLALRAWMGLAIGGFGTAVAYALSYFRTLRKIVEEPDIMPGSGTAIPAPRFGNAVQTAIGRFSVRTLLRSRQHRVILAFYYGIAFALTIFLLSSSAVRPQPSDTRQVNTRQPLPDAPVSDPWREPNAALLASSIVMMVFGVVGTRVVFTIPLDLRANWTFRLAGMQSGPESLAAIRRALLLLSVAPVWLASAVLCFWLWPWRQAAGHLALLGLLGVILADLCLHGFRKIPFTCSYLPGKSKVNMVFLYAAGVMWFITLCVRFERRLLQEPRNMATILVLFVLAAVCTRSGAAALTRLGEEELKFEEEPVPAVFELGLHRDGVVSTGPPA